MSRILFFEELETGLPARETLTAIAEAIMTLPKARIGNLVVFGSVVWDAHTWRSDIDIALIRPPYVLPGSTNPCEPGEVIRLGAFELYQELKSHDVLAKDELAKFFPAGLALFQILNYIDNDEIKDDLPEIGPSEGKPYNIPAVDPRLSPSLRDHFVLLARHFGEPWATFLENLPYRRGRTRTHDIRGYVENVRSRYEDYQEFLEFQRGEGRIRGLEGWNIEEPLRALQSVESMPKQLMRKILGQKKAMVSPDTPEHMLERFKCLPHPWVPEMLELFRAFFSLGKNYEQLVETTVANISTAHSGDYWHEIWGLYQGLPVNELASLVNKAFPCHCFVCRPRA
jgi:hypothetical protein